MKFFRKSALSSATCLQGAAFAVALAGLPGVAMAQDAAPADSAQCADENSNSICDADEKKDLVVTGSRLTRPTLSSPTPVTSVNVAELTDRGSVSLGDSLNNLPSLRSTFSSGNSTRFIGTAGLNILDLRGLGTSRTLVLVNGRRHVTALPGTSLIDVNTIPVDLLERVDIVTGGNSAIYGSDAVAGVVNFILKRDFDGISIKGQGGVSSRGDRGNYFISGTWGKNFADGRGNIAVSGEFARAEPLYFRDRNYLTGAYSGRCQFQLMDPTGGEPFGTDGIPDNQFVCGVRNAAISDGGTVGALDPSSSSTRRYLRFGSNGMPFVDTPTLSYAPVGSGNQLGGQGSTLRNTGMMLAGVERYTANLLFRYEFSDAMEYFAEAKYVHVWANQEGQPSFLNSGPQSVGGAPIRCNNGFLSAAALTALQSYGLCPNPAVNTINLARFNIDFGGRGEFHKRDTYRVVSGLRGTFNEDWKYELAVNYGRLETSQRSLNNLKLFDVNGNLDGFNLASNAVLAPVGFTGTNFELNSAGQRVICAVNASSNVRPDCVPINLFGFGAPSRAALAFVNTEGHREERAEQFIVSLNLAGDLSQLFELPGGPVGWSLGGEYREETARSAWDALVASGGTFLNALQPFNPPKLTVKEVYGEVDLPLLKDMPFAKELTVRGAGRMSDYNTTTGTVYAWNVDGIWAPINDIRFRAAYATSVRAPTQSDLFSPNSQNFAFIADPCDQANILSGPNRVANCAAAGVPTTYNAAASAACASTAFSGPVGTPWVNCLARTSSTSFTSGGNPNLVAEKGKSLTLGVVIEPHWIPGLNFTVDWYRIRVESLIATLGAQTIINLCYDSPSLANQYCANVNRDPATGLFANPAALSSGINFAAQKTEGIDFDLSYRKTFDNGQKLSIRAIATRVIKLDNYVSPTSPTLPDRQMGELGDPIWAAGLTFNYDFGAVDVTYSARYIGKQTIGAWEAQNRYTGFCPASGTTGSSGRSCTPGQLALLDPQNADQFSQIYYPSALYQNVRLNFELPGKKYAFYVGVDNFMDKKPPLGLLGTAGGDDFDTVGRLFYAGFRINM
jgi:outer membrane receptor protein involved in Fe transport